MADMPLPTIIVQKEPEQQPAPLPTVLVPKAPEIKPAPVSMPTIIVKTPQTQPESKVTEYPAPRIVTKPSSPYSSVPAADTVGSAKPNTTVVTSSPIPVVSANGAKQEVGTYEVPPRHPLLAKIFKPSTPAPEKVVSVSPPPPTVMDKPRRSRLLS
jgi:hypothetical protein